MKIGRVILWLGRIGETLVLLAIVALIAVYVWLHSGAGMDWLAGQVSTATRGQVEISGISGRLPFHMDAERLRIRDHEEKEWLSAQSVSIVLSLPMLFRGEVVFRQVHAERLEWTDMPTYGEDSPDEESTTEQPAQARPWIKRLEIESLTLGRFLLSDSILPWPVTGNASGRVTWFSGGKLESSARMIASVDGQPEMEITASAVWDTQTLILPTVQVSHQSDTLRGSGRFDFSDRNYSAQAALQVGQVENYRYLHKLDLAGQLDASLEFRRDGVLSPWSVQGEAASSRLRYDQITGDSLALTGRLEWVDREWKYQAGVLATTLFYGDWLLTDPRVDGRGGPVQHDLRIQTAGSFQNQSDFAAEAEVQVAWRGPDDGLHLSVDAFTGNWAGIRLLAPEPFVFHWSKPVSSIKAPGLIVDDTSIQGMVQWVEGSLDVVDLTIYPVDLSLISRFAGEQAPDIQGEASLMVRFANLRQSPSGSATLTADQISIDYSFLHHFENAAINLQADLRPMALSIKGAIQHPLLNHFLLEAALPLEPSGGMFPLTLDSREGFSARVRMSGNLRDLSETMLTRPMALAGSVEVDLTACHLPHEPDFDGYFAWREGSFRNLTTGTFLDQIHVVFRGEGNQLKIEEGRARDGGRGTVHANGFLAFDPDWAPSWDFSAELNQATLFRLIQTELPLTGKITSQGDSSAAGVQGEMWLEPFRFTIPRRLPPSIRPLEVIEINHPDPRRNTNTNRNENTVQAQAGEGREIDLDIRVRTRRSFDVIGRGLQSEWRGSMRLTGTSRNPELVGGAQVVRGFAMLLGRRFNLTEGRLEFTGAMPPNPQLNVVASTRIADIVANILVSGPANRPDITLTSDPLLPEDEIMAMILFGRSVETMSPWQAIALANGLRVLSGGGDVVNVLEGAQSLAQIDQIDIKQDEEGAGLSSVAVGKYFGSRFFVQGEKGFGEAEDVVTVTIELTPRLILETESSPRIREGVSLYWRKDL